MNWYDFLEKEEVTRKEIIKWASNGYYHSNGDEIVTVEHQLQLVEKIFKSIDNGYLLS